MKTNKIEKCANRESNPALKLGKLQCYRYTIGALHTHHSVASGERYSQKKYPRWLRHCVRVVKELVLKANGLCPREFKSRRCRFLFVFLKAPKKKVQSVGIEPTLLRTCALSMRLNHSAKTADDKIVLHAGIEPATFGS